MLREELGACLEGLLDPTRFRDYCPNGLQVEGRAVVQNVVCGVTASQALIDAAIARGADAILVHHGWFWKGEDGRVTGMRKRRLQTLLAQDINLFAYHLPLDAHAELGNNAQLAARLGWEVTGRFAEQDIGFLGVLPAPTFAHDLVRQVGTCWAGRLCSSVLLTVLYARSPGAAAGRKATSKRRFRPAPTCS